MKHQGKEGFTWDSKAEEWAAWAGSVFEHNRPKSVADLERLGMLWHSYKDDVRATTIPANQWSDPDPYRVISWRDEPRKASLWPFAAIALIAAVLVAVIWSWG